MRIGVLSQWFDPEPGPAAIPGVFAREFVKSGHDVSVLTGFPNYPEGRIYAGYRQRLRWSGRLEGYDVTRVALYPNHGSSAIGRIANYASFGASATALGRCAMSDVDAIWVYNSPITVSLPLLVQSNGGRKPYFLHVQDLWPDSLIESGMFPRGRVGDVVSAAIQRIVRTTENRASVIGVISPGVKDLILHRNPDLDPAKIQYVPNPTDEALFRPQSELRSLHEVMPPAGLFTLMYVGAVGQVQGLDTLIEAAEILGSDAGVRIVIVGDGIARRDLEEKSRRRGLDHVTFVGRIAKDDVPLAMMSADAQLVSLGDAEFLKYTTPSKIASLLCSEVPIVAQISGDGASMLKRSGAALTTPPGDANALARAIKSMATKSAADRAAMSIDGRRYYLENLSAQVSASKIVNSLDRAMTQV